MSSGVFGFHRSGSSPERIRFAASAERNPEDMRSSVSQKPQKPGGQTGNHHLRPQESGGGALRPDGSVHTALHLKTIAQL